MPPRTYETLYDLSRFGPLLASVERAGFEVSVVGGLAVGAYGRLCGTSSMSGDLDLYLSPSLISDFIDWARAAGLELVHRPMPRALQTAMLTWEGICVDVLAEATGLPPPDVVLSRSREFELSDCDGLVVSVADPYDLLANKLAVRRDKDLPHIDILRRFIDEEVVTTFAEEGRRRLSAARRLMDVLDTRTLPEALAARMVPVARDPLGRRFLVNSVPVPDMVATLVAQAADDAERTQLETLAARRAFGAI